MYRDISKQPQQEYHASVMSYITLSLVTIIGITLISIFISFWVTELADKDAQAINLSGSMRMQTYLIGMNLQRGEFQQAQQNIHRLHKTWNHPIFSHQHAQLGNTPDKHTRLNQLFTTAYDYWLNQLQPRLQEAVASQQAPDNLAALLDQHVLLTDKLVTQFQEDAERKIVNLRTFQLVVLLITVLVGSLIFYLLKNRIEKPLSQLTETADKIRQGDLTQQVEVSGRDELGLLASTFNRMTQSIANSYSVLEERVESRTQELQQNNIALEFLFRTAREILQSPNGEFSYADTLNRLAKIIDRPNLELCLFTEQGERPYLQLVSGEGGKNPCDKTDCLNCRNVSKPDELIELPGHRRFPIVMAKRFFGTIDLHLDDQATLADWKQNLIQSVANQFAIALSMSEQKDRENRFAMLNERTVIARELHDSLAQALSYLQIQVTRLQKSKDRQKYELQQAIIDELREGLSSAYRQLRELLTTFRLKMDDGGLYSALLSTVQQLQERSDMQIELDYEVGDIPLSASEEIHLLQIVREAGQNAVYHSKGNNVNISLRHISNSRVELRVDDDGIGIPDTPEKLNHYGLAIMSERSRNLGGTLDISLRKSGGTSVSFTFIPNYNREEALISTHKGE